MNLQQRIEALVVHRQGMEKLIKEQSTRIAELEAEITRLKHHAEAMAEAQRATRSMISWAVAMVEHEMGEPGMGRVATVSPTGIVAELYARMAPMCLTLDESLAAYRRDYPGGDHA